MATDSGPSKYKSGGRTRSIINLASPGDAGVLAYTFTETTAEPVTPYDNSSPPSAAGYNNYGQNKTLHVVFMNNAAGTCKFTFYLYHSFARAWGNLHTIDPDAGTNTLVEVTVAADEDQYYIIPIEGAERVAVRCTTYAGGQSVHCYLGVNSI